MAPGDPVVDAIGTEELAELAVELLDVCRKKRLMVATAESCTGGLVTACLTDIPGSSAAVDRGFVTYSNEAKTEMLGVPAALIAQHGAVSEPVARAMARGALARSRAHLVIAITGIAGPGGSAVKPEGLVHFACATRRGDLNHKRIEFGPIGRGAVRAAAVTHALRMLLEAAQA
ncbi:CinA family protein [Limibaculum sp. M0105]|uniref:CinA family protein n=2 Tax=Thermohalobaculum xanthum TaxID=2753746 RepID=A0A8J7M424_9RHOB|nr:CinA family protein [Thermohalobaculum xanthum]